MDCCVHEVVGLEHRPAPSLSANRPLPGRPGERRVALRPKRRLMRHARLAAAALGPYGRLLVASELLLAVGAIAEGAHLMVAPNTAFPAAWLTGTPWTSSQWPGLALIACNGAVPVAVAFGALQDRPSATSGIRSSGSRSWAGSPWS
jgi:hypothetical protein